MYKILLLRDDAFINGQSALFPIIQAAKIFLGTGRVPFIRREGDGAPSVIDRGSAALIFLTGENVVLCWVASNGQGKVTGKLMRTRSPRKRFSKDNRGVPKHQAPSVTGPPTEEIVR